MFRIFKVKTVILLQMLDDDEYGIVMPEFYIYFQTKL